MKHYLVTGGAGFIGAHIARRLISEGHAVTVIDNLSTGSRNNVPAKAAFIELDLGSELSLQRLGKFQCDAVFHLAGQSSGEASFIDPDYDFRSHVVSTFNLLKWCRNNEINRFLYASSMSVYGDPKILPVPEEHPYQPKTFYAAGKVSAESYLRFYQTLGINTTIFRMFSVYGPGQNLDNKMQGMLSIYLSYMLENQPVIVKGSKDRFRDFIYIDDIVDAWLLCLNNPKSFGMTYNLGSGNKTTVEELLTAMAMAMGDSNYPIQYGKSTPGDQHGVVADTMRIYDDLGWSPRVDVAEGLRRMIAAEKRGITLS